MRQRPDIPGFRIEDGGNRYWIWADPCCPDGDVSGFIYYEALRWIPKKRRYSTRSRHWCTAYYCPIYTCAWCGRRGSAKDIRSRSELCTNEWLEAYPAEICWSCRNKAYPIVRRFRELAEQKSAINRLRREISNVKKNQNLGGHEGLPDGTDG